MSSNKWVLGSGCAPQANLSASNPPPQTVQSPIQQLSKRLLSAAQVFPAPRTGCWRARLDRTVPEFQAPARVAAPTAPSATGGRTGEVPAFPGAVIERAKSPAGTFHEEPARQRRLRPCGFRDYAAHPLFRREQMPMVPPRLQGLKWRPEKCRHVSRPAVACERLALKPSGHLACNDVASPETTWHEVAADRRPAELPLCHKPTQA